MIIERYIAGRELVMLVPASRGPLADVFKEVLNAGGAGEQFLQKSGGVLLSEKIEGAFDPLKVLQATRCEGSIGCLCVCYWRGTTDSPGAS